MENIFLTATQAPKFARFCDPSSASITASIFHKSRVSMMKSSATLARYENPSRRNLNNVLSRDHPKRRLDTGGSRK